MIQRIQSLYLFVASALMAVTLFAPLARFAGEGSEFRLYAFAFRSLDGAASQPTLYMGVLLAAACALPLVTLFLPAAVVADPVVRRRGGVAHRGGRHGGNLLLSRLPHLFRSGVPLPGRACRHRIAARQPRLRVVGRPGHFPRRGARPGCRSHPLGWGARVFGACFRVRRQALVLVGRFFSGAATPGGRRSACADRPGGDLRVSDPGGLSVFSVFRPYGFRIFLFLHAAVSFCHKKSGRNFVAIQNNFNFTHQYFCFGRMLAFQPELLLFVLLKSFFMKSLNFWRSLFFSALAAAAFGACSDDDKGGDVDASITVNDKEATTIGIASAGGETEAVSVVSSGTWTLAFESDQDWCIPNITSGKAGTSSLVFTVDPMPAGIEERSATAILTTVGMIFNVEVPVKVSVTVRQSPSGSALPETNVAAVRALLVAMNPTSTKTDVTAEIGAMTLTGIVVSNSEGKNTGSTWNMAVQDGVVAKNSGLTISSSKFQSASYTPGTCVTVALTGAQVQLYNGLLQLNIADAAAEAVKTVSTEAPEPVVIAPDALFDYESMLVQIANCYPVSGYGTAWNSGATNTGGNGGNVNFVTTEGQAFVCRTGSSAAFKDQIVPEKMGSLIGIAGRYNNDKQVSPRTLADIKLTETIPAPEYTLAKIGNITNGGNYKVENATVIATYAAGFLMQDDTGIILVYPGSAENPVAIPAVGKIVTVEGLVSPYGGVLQFGEGSKVAETGTGSVPTPPGCRDYGR